jgi:hypothetical protein
MRMTSKVLREIYDSHVLAARARSMNDAVVGRVLDPGADPRLVELFLIHYCSLGVPMTEPVEGWIRRAGEGCRAIGLDALGKSLVTHAHHEAGHHRMMMEDTHRLVSRWNARHAPRLDAGLLLAREPTRSARAYVELHEGVIGGPAPFCQIAIEFEVENLSPTLGPRLVENVRRVLGEDVVAALSFLNEHIALDVGHTQLNAKMMEQLLLARPDQAAAMGAVGARALHIYLDFMGECVERAASVLAQHEGTLRCRRDRPGAQRSVLEAGACPTPSSSDPDRTASPPQPT